MNVCMHVVCGKNNLKQSITCSGAKFIVTSITAGMYTCMCTLYAFGIHNNMQENFNVVDDDAKFLSALNTWRSKKGEHEIGNQMQSFDFPLKQELRRTRI